MQSRKLSVRKSSFPSGKVFAAYPLATWEGTWETISYTWESVCFIGLRGRGAEPNLTTGIECTRISAMLIQVLLLP
jgi:hypothetical protein